MLRSDQWLRRMGIGCAFSMAILSQGHAFGNESAEVDFETHVAPIFRDHCVECHSADDQNGGLRLDHPSAITTEGDSGKHSIVSGDPRNSEILVRVLSNNEDDQMPPDGDRLTDQQIDTLRAWISAGAAWPQDPDHSGDPIDESETHWAFKPLWHATPPSDRSGWSLSPIDQFVASRRSDAGLTAANDADPIAFLRRATYDLTGLPPTPGEVDSFLQRHKQVGLDQAIRELVERLLASPSYGERWGRHWMDWVRYADTAGDNSDYPIPQAYLYRNYIFESLNQDVPYDRFVTEQLAGDLLPAESIVQRNRQLIATGYLAMARRFGSLVERYPWHLTIEDTIDNVGKTMLGMTLACARCHDHKFDPVSTREYYGLYGFFASTRYPFPGIELFKAQQDFASLLDPAATSKHLSEYEPKTKKLTTELNQQLERCRVQAVENAEREKSCSLDEKRKMRDELDGMLIKARRAGEKLAAHLREIPDYPTAYAVSDAVATNARIQIKGEPTRPGGEVVRGFPAVLGGQTLDSETAAQSSGRLQLANWVTSADNPLFARVIVNRVWQKHFGTGLVASTSDFGLRGEKPSHPSLLDYLATQFINDGYSIKQLHRQIMTSRTYRLASIGDPDNAVKDPGNRLLWKFNRQRLDAESIRDTLLVLAGQLDTAPQTEPFPFPKKSDWSFTQHHPFKGDYPNQKRSVYQLTKRLTVGTYLQTFDGPDPNVCTAERDQSVTSLQALYFFNDDFLHDQSLQFADRLLEASSEQGERIDVMFRKILNRSPDEDEFKLVTSHLQSARAALGNTSAGGQVANQRAANKRAVWASVIRGMFRLNEFLYLD
ncbi:PSD1 and planctomycete cytochrome C domain-containing protein [Roseiconus lacunae]|uniref:PSD1 and planctomycete cytochrome C domain-containing protein n=1 Tax=Roseiconus lacunae TaxID=2605694 RepID=UPI001E45F81F|nr:PSD1 and planctomycete cytochrome C domain-containing protein [Roseiconus lacunae]MCD0463416.1 PSD1 and planctomycete cytochrome C domain-containing protein [Roseiconus lacunae]